MNSIVKALLAGLAAASYINGTVPSTGAPTNDTNVPTAPDSKTVVEEPVAKVIPSHGNWSNPACYSYDLALHPAYINIILNILPPKPATGLETLLDLCSNDHRLRFVPGNPSLAGSNMTITVCLDRCTPHGYVFAGVKYPSDRYCDNMRPNKYYIGGSCKMPCNRDRNEACGASQSLLIYEHSV